MKSKKKRMGRPPLPKSERRSSNFTMRLTMAERREIEREAAARNTTVSDILLAAWKKSKGA